VILHCSEGGYVNLRSITEKRMCTVLTFPFTIPATTTRLMINVADIAHLKALREPLLPQLLTTVTDVTTTSVTGTDGK